MFSATTALETHFRIPVDGIPASSNAMTKDEARLIMNGWLERQSHLTLIGTMLGFRVAVRCQVNTVTESGVLLLTADGGRLAVDLSIKETEFRYSEPREFTGPQVALGPAASKKIASSVTILFPWRASLDDPDDSDSEAESITLIERID
jgi:hypothetical protein